MTFYLKFWPTLVKVYTDYTSPSVVYVPRYHYILPSWPLLLLNSTKFRARHNLLHDKQNILSQRQTNLQIFTAHPCFYNWSQSITLLSSIDILPLCYYSTRSGLFVPVPEGLQPSKPGLIGLNDLGGFSSVIRKKTEQAMHALS